MKLFLVNQEPETVTLLKLSKIVGNNAKGRISKRVFQENKACQIFRKMNISYPLIISTRTCAQQGVRNVRFSKFGVFCFLETPVLRFVLLPYYRQIVNAELCKHCELNNKKNTSHRSWKFCEGVTNTTVIFFCRLKMFGRLFI